MFGRVRDYLNRYNMISMGDRIVAGISGGADSVCLLLFLKSIQEEYGLFIHVVHVNHGIRTEGAARDEQFVEKLCKRLDVGCEIVRADIPALSRENGTSEEEEGRNVRRRAFESACERWNCGKIAVAHNMNDNVETVVFNLARGTGIRGMGGIRPVLVSDEDSRFTVIRPMLCLTKPEIVRYLEERNEAYCTDETNENCEYSRNVIRNKILPVLSEDVNSAAIRHIDDFSKIATDAEAYISRETKRVLESMERGKELIRGNGFFNLSIAALERVDSYLAARVIRELVGEACGGLKDITATHILEVMSLKNGQSGRKVSLPGEVFVYRTFDILIFSKLSRKAEAPGRIETRVRTRPLDEEVPKNNCIKWFDYDKIGGHVEVRTKRPGDYIRVRKGEGKGLGKKSLKSLLTELKVDSTDRDRLPLLALEDHILWIGGMRGTDDYRVDEGTKTILEAKYIKDQR